MHNPDKFHAHGSSVYDAASNPVARCVTEEAAVSLAKKMSEVFYHAMLGKDRFSGTAYYAAYAKACDAPNAPNGP